MNINLCCLPIANCGQQAHCQWCQNGFRLYAKWDFILGFIFEKTISINLFLHNKCCVCSGHIANKKRLFFLERLSMGEECYIKNACYVCVCNVHRTLNRIKESVVGYYMYLYPQLMPLSLCLFQRLLLLHDTHYHQYADKGCITLYVSVCRSDRLAWK